ncbi:MAG: hypothetical protein ACOCRK_01255 [bacterium]
MAYNNNAPEVTNNVLDDVSAIKNNLDELRKNEVSETYPDNLVSGMTFSRIEPRDDGLGDKIVVYLRNEANDGWLKVYDEEYGNNADLYKGNDIDSDGDGKVDSAEQADSATDADKIDGKHYSDIQSWVNNSADVPNADYADEAGDANTVDGKHASELGLSISIIQGYVSDESTLPLPSGYSQSECNWIVSIRYLETEQEVDTDGTNTYCRVDGTTREVTCYSKSGQSYDYGTVNYLVIGVK